MDSILFRYYWRFVILVPSFVSLTAASETAVPLLSVTVPFTLPDAVCARAAEADTDKTTRRIAAIFANRMRIPRA